jgi:hypothetical protein
MELKYNNKNHQIVHYCKDLLQHKNLDQQYLHEHERIYTVNKTTTKKNKTNQFVFKFKFKLKQYEKENEKEKKKKKSHEINEHMKIIV